MADALDSGSSEVTLVWVQLPSTASIPRTFVRGIFAVGDIPPYNRKLS